MAKKYPFIEYDELAIDSLSMQLVMEPSKFDVLVMGNLYGDIISDLTSGLVGGLGVVPGANIGKDYAIFLISSRNKPSDFFMTAALCIAVTFLLP